MALLVEAHDLLADRRAAARDDARLGDGRPRGVAEKPRRLDALFREDVREPLRRGVLAEQADGVDRAAERLRVVRDICRAARDDFLSRLLEYEHGRLARDARDAPIDIDIRHHIPDDEDAAARQLLHDVSCFPSHRLSPHHGVNCHCTFQVSCFER